jgi:hypothetical protein
VHLHDLESLISPQKAAALYRGGLDFASRQAGEFTQMQFDLIVVIETSNQVKMRHFENFMS